MNSQIIVTQQSPLTQQQQAMAHVGQAANHHAKTAVFGDYLSRKSENTKRAHLAGLGVFADFLAAVNVPGIDADCLQQDPACWHGITWGMVEAFKKWMLTQGYSVATVNHRLSVVKVYAKLASKAGAIDKLEYLQMKDVSGYSGNEVERIDQQRETTRMGHKKATHTELTPDQVQLLLESLDTAEPQQLRDSLIFRLMLGYSLRVSEVAGLTFSGEAYDKKSKAKQPLFFDTANGRLSIYRKKTSTVQTIELTGDTLDLARRYVALRPDCDHNLVFVGSMKGGQLTSSPMSDRAINKRVGYHGKKILGLDSLSPHDCRHFWATYSKGDIDRLKDAGGWASYTMLTRYRHGSKIANEGVESPI